MEETYVNRCRACAGFQDSSKKMISLFENHIVEMFTFCTSLEIVLNDCLPNHICFECYGHLANFSKFRQNCLDSDILLRGEIATTLFKAEPVDEDELLKHEENVDVLLNHDANDDVLLKCEENEVNGDFPDFQSKSSETEMIDDNFSENDLDDAFAESQNLIYTSEMVETTKLICDYCGQQFDKKGALASHMVKHKEKRVPTNFPCDVAGCNKTFTIKKSLLYHKMNVHKMEREACGSKKKLKLCCDKCPKWFTIQHKLDAHIRGEHEGLEPYKCPHCEKVFNHSRRYNHHIKLRHNEDTVEKFRCTYDGCDKEYGVKDSLRMHVKQVHLGIPTQKRNQKLICDQCGKSFKNGYSLREHSYTHTGNRPFACERCPKKFASNYDLNLHTMRHLKIRKFVCTVCGARKTTNVELQAHLNFHSKEITYPCKECDRVFASYGAISRHVRIHHRHHKPYICPHCQRAFTKADTLKNHIMTHTGEKPFSCSVCGHRFIQSVALKTHMKVHAKK